MTRPTSTQPASTPPPIIRPRRDTDRPALVSALREVYAASGYPSAWPDDPAAFLAPPALAAWVAELEGAAVGQVVLRLPDEPLPAWVSAALDASDAPDTPDTAPGAPLGAGQVAIIARLFVAPQAQGRGLARALFRTAWAGARGRGLRGLLDVHTDSPAPIRLYEAEGWQRVATLDAPWLDAQGQRPRIHVYRSPLEPPFICE